MVLALSPSLPAPGADGANSSVQEQSIHNNANTINDGNRNRCDEHLNDRAGESINDHGARALPMPDQLGASLHLVSGLHNQQHQERRNHNHHFQQPLAPSLQVHAAPPSLPCQSDHSYVNNNEVSSAHLKATKTSLSQRLIQRTSESSVPLKTDHIWTQQQQAKLDEVNMKDAQYSLLPLVQQRETNQKNGLEDAEVETEATVADSPCHRTRKNRRSSTGQGPKGKVVVGLKPVALDGGYGWVIVLGSFLIHVFADGFVYSFGVLADSLLQEFDASNAEVSTVLSVLTGLMLATGPLASAVCNKIGCRLTTIVGALVASVGCALSSFAQSMTPHLLLSVGLVMGTGFGLMYCPAIVIVTIYFERYRALATGITVCGAGVGTLVFSKLITWLLAVFNWRSVFLIYSGLVLVCVFCGALYRPIEFEPIYAQDGDYGDGDREDEEQAPNKNQQTPIECCVQNSEDAKNNGLAIELSSLMPLPQQRWKQKPADSSASERYPVEVLAGPNPRFRCLLQPAMSHPPPATLHKEPFGAHQPVPMAQDDYGPETSVVGSLSAPGAGSPMFLSHSIGDALNATAEQRQKRNRGRLHKQKALAREAGDEVTTGAVPPHSLLLPGPFHDAQKQDPGTGFGPGGPRRLHQRRFFAGGPPGGAGNWWWSGGGGGSRTAANSGTATPKISISSGYLNIKDVFYFGSVEQLSEYVDDPGRFRSVSSSLSSRPGGPQRRHHHHHSQHQPASPATSMPPAVAVPGDPNQQQQQQQQNQQKKRVGGLHTAGGGGGTIDEAVLEEDEECDNDEMADKEAILPDEIGAGRGVGRKLSDDSDVKLGPVLGTVCCPPTGPQARKQSTPKEESNLATKTTQAIGSTKAKKVEGRPGGLGRKDCPSASTSSLNTSSTATVTPRGALTLGIWRTVKRLTDVSLLADPVYLVFAVSNLFTSIGFNIPPMFMPLHAEKILGLSKVDAAWSVSAYGLANMAGRIFFGLISDRRLGLLNRLLNICRCGPSPSNTSPEHQQQRARNRFLIYSVTLAFSGLLCCMVPGVRSFAGFLAYCFLFGFLISAYICLCSVVLVDLLGVARLTNAFGLLLFVQGFATFCGPPFAGFLFDLTARYDWTFAFCGLCLVASGLVMFVIPARYQQMSSSSAGAPAVVVADSAPLLVHKNDGIENSSV